MSFESHKEPNKLELIPFIVEGIENERINLDSLRSEIQVDPELTPQEKQTALLELAEVQLLNNKQAKFAARLQEAA